MKQQFNSKLLKGMDVMDRKISILVLALMDFLLLVSGIIYFFYSINEGIYYMVLNAKIPGAVFAAAAIFLGVRYFRAILRMRNKMIKENLKFSWNNFRK